MRTWKSLVFLAPLGLYALMSMHSGSGPTLGWFIAALLVAIVAYFIVDGTLFALHAAWKRSLRLPGGLDILVWAVCAALSLPAALFLAGAVGFPLFNAYYRWTFLVTVFLANISYGLDSVFRLGYVQTCGFLSGNCTDHDVRWIAMVLWPLICGAMLLLWYRGRQTQRETP